VFLTQNNLLQVRGLEKSYDGVKVLKGIDLDVAQGEFITLLGPSGCGKTTTLRIIAGLTQPENGSVILNGEDITAFAPEKRGVNTVFQSYALFPHMNVEKNISYGLRIRGMKKAQWQDRVREMLSLVQLEGYEKRMPGQLSGGQRQRVAIARAVVLGPQLLLLDEPLGALDLKLRQQMQYELKEIQKRLGIAFIYITHDQEEALNMSDRIAVMRDGMFDQIGTPEEIYERPATRFTAEFVGQSNSLICRVENVRGDGMLSLSFEGASLPARPCDAGVKAGDEVLLCLRTSRVTVLSKPTECCLGGVLKSRQYAGGTMRLSVVLPSGREIISTQNEVEELSPGQHVYVCWDPRTAAVVR